MTEIVRSVYYVRYDVLPDDDRLGFSKDQLQQILKEGQRQLGATKQQVARFAAEVDKYASKFPAAADYQPGSIL